MHITASCHNSDHTTEPDTYTTYHYTYDHEEMIHHIERLCTLWHNPADKGDPDFLFKPIYVGLLWHLPLQQVSLPEKKHTKYLNRVLSFITNFSGHQCCLLTVEKLHSTLCHCTFMYLEGCSSLSSLSNFMSRFKGNKYLLFYPPHSVMADLNFWKEALSDLTFYCQLNPKGPIQDLRIYIDASTD
uniref:Reverse transcriptase/retrotransposon-derived protein RNase H-like domain-containing protein n=1 Tax=Moniliophthora roreri TaxID=221103 RepID=A0A0W0FTE9_MONRR